MIYKIEPTHRTSKAKASILYIDVGGDEYKFSNEKEAVNQARQKSGLGRFKNDWFFKCLGYLSSKNQKCE
jgi:hypothetical protein